MGWAPWYEAIWRVIYCYVFFFSYFLLLRRRWKYIMVGWVALASTCNIYKIYKCYCATVYEIRTVWTFLHHHYIYTWMKENGIVRWLLLFPYKYYARYQLNQSKNAIVDPHAFNVYTLSHYNKLLLLLPYIYTYQKGMKFMLFYFVLFFLWRFVKGNFIHIAWFVLP